MKFGRNYFRRVIYFHFLKHLSSQHQRKNLCDHDTATGRQNTQTYTKCIFLHEEVEFCLACFAQYRKMKDSREENK